MKYEYAFMGCGNMGGALLTAVARVVDPKKIAACDRDTAKVEAYCVSHGVVAEQAQKAAKSCRFFVIGVKPQALGAAASEVKAVLSERKDVCLISMVLGASIARIKTLFGDLPVIRIMPNTPVLVGKGVTLYTASGVSQEDEESFLRDFAQSGMLEHVPEAQFDATAALSGCAPAYCYLFLEALADGAVECGVPRRVAQTLAAQVMAGSAQMVETYGSPSDLKDAVCSPGGSTIAGVHALEKAGFRGAAMDAIVAAYQKTLQFKK
ncbi:MAG: pyrroline-5-carboxylate reductase [Clostridiales bacterium]|nr:pyrroline-5-carboxylate reductase [Clostridiales bacterium]